MCYNTLMSTFSQSEVFFMISSVGFVVLWIFVAVFLFYLIRATKTFNRIIERVEGDINKLGDVTRDMLDDLRDSVVWNFLFRKKKSRRRE